MSLSNNVYVFSGFRDDTLKAQIEAKSGKVAASLVKNATHLLVKKDAKPSKKVADAEEKGLKIVFLEDFIDEMSFTLAEKKPRGKKPKAAEDEEKHSESGDEEETSDIELLSKIMSALATGKGKEDALAALDALKKRLA